MSLTNQEVMNYISDSLDAAMHKENDDKSAKHKGRVTSRFWPTEASAMTPKGIVGKCRRKTYYSQQGVKQAPFDTSTLGRFKVGHNVESWITDLAKVAGLHKDNSVRIQFNPPQNEKVTISGEIDLIYQLPDGENLGVEIKSSYGYMFSSYVFHKATVPGMPRIAHVLQVLLYLYYCKYVDPTLGISRFEIHYVDRGSMTSVHHVVEMDDELRPIINGISMTNIDNYTNPIYSMPKVNVTKTHAKLVEFEFNMNDVMARYCEVFEYHESGLLFPKEYNPLYDNNTIAAKRASGEVSKSRYDEYSRGKTSFLCDVECGYCDYREQCMKDDGII